MLCFFARIGLGRGASGRLGCRGYDGKEGFGDGVGNHTQLSCTVLTALNP